MNNIVIVGCNFSGLYSAMKCIDNGIPVIIVEKNSMCSDEIINYKIFNKNHSYYIQLLSRLSIKYSKYNLNFNEKILYIINTILHKAKHIPSKFLYMQTFDKLCYTLLSQADYSYLKKNINKYDNIYCNITALYGISMFNNELNDTNE
jgi:ribulose 1,5-bisphosphate synthetase/thiazole synthase